MDNAVAQSPKRDVWLVPLELAILTSLFVADAYHHIFFSKTPYLFLLGWASLRLRGLRWKDVGFSPPGSWKLALLVGLLAGVFIEAFELFISQPLLARWMGKMPDLSAFNVVHGHLEIAIIYVFLIWILAAFGEELVYRGYLMNRLAGLFRFTRSRWVVSFIVIAIVFGCSHTGQGSTGILENIWDGLLLGAVYLACGRNLTAAIVAHGVTDTVDLLLMYLGKYPGIS